MANTEINNNSTDFQTIPIMKTFFSDTLTPIDVVQQLGDRVAYLLESKDDESAWGRYSFVGLDPFAYIKMKKDKFIFESRKGDTILTTQTMKQAVEEALAFLKVKPLETEIPFYGGAVGAISYDAISDFESITLKDKAGIDIPMYSFVFCNTHLIFDHKKKSLTVVQLVHLNDCFGGKEYNEQYRKADKRINRLVKQLDDSVTRQSIFPIITSSHDDFQKVKSNYSKKMFVNHVKQIQEYIRSGDIFQAVLSQRFEIPLSVSALDIYRVLRTINPSPYLFYINIDGAEIVGSSPERLVNVIDGKIEIHPIAGTRKRGETTTMDYRLAEELLHDEKEKAEHLMLVDLARNDVGRIAQYGSVNVPVLMELGKFSQVMHLVSKVTGLLDTKYSPMDAFISSFPAGTVSGAPKIRAMQIIDELEPTRRGLYAGSVGYIGYDQTIDTCITIRTIVVKDHTAYVQAGAGIVADSIPELEWMETRNKARALIKAINIATDYFKEGKDAQYA